MGAELLKPLTALTGLGCVQMDMRAGVAYAVVVDGFNGQFGPYQIDITADQVRAPRQEAPAGVPRWQG